MVKKSSKKFRKAKTAKKVKKVKRRVSKQRKPRAAKAVTQVQFTPKQLAKAKKLQHLGTVVHYFNELGVAVINLKNPLRAGDKIKFAGATTDFEQVAKSIQLNRKPMQLARAGVEVGLKVRDRVRRNDLVFKLP